MPLSHRSLKLAAVVALVLVAGSAAVILRPRPASAAVVERQLPRVETALQSSAADVGWSPADLAQAVDAIDAALSMLSGADHDEYMNKMAARGLTLNEPMLRARVEQRLNTSAWKQAATHEDAPTPPPQSDAAAMLRFLLQTDRLLGDARIVSINPSEMKVSQGPLSLSAGRHARGSTSAVDGWNAQFWSPPAVNVEIPVTLAGGEQADCVLSLTPIEGASGPTWWVSNLTFIRSGPGGSIPTF